MFLAAKIRALKKAIRSWRNFEHRSELKESDDLRKRNNELDLIVESRPLSIEETTELQKNKIRINDLDRFRRLDLKQKAHIKWTVDGDENTSFFHGILKGKNRNNKIHGLSINGTWCNDPQLIKQAAFDFFSSKFKDKWPHRPKLTNSNIKVLNQHQKCSLEEPFSLDEIKKAVWSC
ncbi:hypothetical protein L2E82_42487 [Cichorium intybus]|uniref:Uncharacterized protein n=1 Tax=Cichorium intybus TaxID=13427 RepID=A0ACB8ZN22_CICIN|nr:hypothetical protein L2E82_42487 [Cichorium intybus]